MRGVASLSLGQWLWEWFCYINSYSPMIFFMYVRKYTFLKFSYSESWVPFIKESLNSTCRGRLPSNSKFRKQFFQHDDALETWKDNKYPPEPDSLNGSIKNQAELTGASGIYRSSVIYGVRRTTFHPLAKCTAMRLSRYIINRRSEVWMIKTVFFIAKASFRNYLLRIELYDYLS